MNLTVVGPRVLIRPDKLPEQTESGLHLVHDRQNTTMRGVVVALGDGPQSRSGNTLPHIVTVGDAVIFSPDSGEELIFESDVLLAMKEDDILAVVD
jgi:co-chaperonin GroES (HSP10)